jgi:hypothetical protein
MRATIWMKGNFNKFYTVLYCFNCVNVSRDSSVGIATAYGLEGPGIESRWGARFSAPVHTSPEAHPASCKIGTVSFLGVRCGRGVTLTPHPLLEPR